MTVYKSKIDSWLVVLIFAPLLFAIYSALESGQYGGILILILSIMFIVYLFTATKYVIKDKVLIVEAGVLLNRKIPIQDIKSVTKTNNPLSSPALSLKRLEIKYGNNFDYILISPLRRDEFVKELLSINPDIYVNI